MLNVLKPLLPKLPETPHETNGEKGIFSWAESISITLERFFDALALKGTDASLIVDNVLQNVAASFTIDAKAPHIHLLSTVAVTSSATTAIKGHITGQMLWIENCGTFNITIKHNAGTKLNGSVDITLTPYGVLAVKWDPINQLWAEISRSLP